MKNLKKKLSYALYTLLATVLFSCDGKVTPNDKVTDTNFMIIYSIRTDEIENYKYEYRLNDGENEVGFRFYSNRVFKIGDTLRICK